MKIWLDVLTPKQVLFFHPLSEELKKNHQVFSTSRHYREASLLAEKVGFDLQLVGSHGGKPLYDKLKASSERIAALAGLMKDWMPDCAISFSSPECARVAFGLGLKHICVNDSPHAESVARLTIPLSDLLMTPWIIPSSAWIKYGINKQKIIKYKALDPAAWLKRRKTAESAFSDIRLDSSKPTILVRLEESHASYLQLYDRSWTRSLLDSLFFQEFNVVVLCRYDVQIEEMNKIYGSKFIIPSNVVDGAGLIDISDVFIGMGGTMTAEAALMGVPTVSAYPGGVTYVEKYLIRQGLVAKPPSIKGVEKAVERLLKDRRKRKWFKNKAHRILDEMEDPIQRIICTIEERK